MTNTGEADEPPAPARICAGHGVQAECSRSVCACRGRFAGGKAAADPQHWESAAAHIYLNDDGE